MSIPDRLWRVVKGRWAMLGDSGETEIALDTEERLAQAAAYEELAEVLRPPTPPPGMAPPVATTPTRRSSLPASGSTAAPAGPGFDPLQASYGLLGVEPGTPLSGIQAAYDARLAELRPEDYPAGSPERTLLEGRRSAVTAAYERLRDTLNPTETRFEHLEF